MRFRPCIDIHNGQVKQIVGGSLKDAGDQATENYASVHGAEYYADLYRRDGLAGGHVILLNPVSSKYYEKTKAQALRALSVYPGGLQVGGGITAENAEAYLEAGASHVIVTSYVFQGGELQWEHLEKLRSTVGKERIVLDLSCRKKGMEEQEESAPAEYYIVTDRWQKFTNLRMSTDILRHLSTYCDEFLVHGVDVEGKASGIDETLAAILGEFDRIPVTYAGGIGTYKDIERFRQVTGGKIDFTVGSALDLFGGKLSYDIVKNIM